MIDTISTILKPAPINQKRTPKRKEAPSTDEALLTARDNLLMGYKKAKRTPRGVFDAAVRIAEERLEQTNYNGPFRTALRRDPIDVWKEVVNKEFDTTWEKAMACVQDEDHEEHEEDADDPDAATPTDMYRTCTVTLKSILRPSLPAEAVERMLTQSQDTVSDTISELQVLIHKALLVVS